jgi:hypothetical protein
MTTKLFITSYRKQFIYSKRVSSSPLLLQEEGRDSIFNMNKLDASRLSVQRHVTFRGLIIE